MGVKRVSETEKTFDLKTGIFCHFGSVLGMSLKNVTSLGSNLASVTNLKGIQTPHNLCCDLGGDKIFTTGWSGSTVQV